MATAPSDMEWQVSTQGPRADTHHLRCFPPGMGNNVQWDTDQRSMVRTGKDMAHQLPGIANSFSCSSDIPEGHVRSLGTTAVGQHYCSGLHQQSGGTVSPQLTSLARSLWLWVLQRDISLTAQHIPGVSNLVTDTESRPMRDRTDWKLSPAIFNRIDRIFGPLEVDLFTSRLTYQLPRYFSWRPDLLAEATDAFQQDWGPLKGFANPPWCLIGRVLSQVMDQKALVVLLAPVWIGQPWYPVLLNILWEFPRRIPPLPNLVQSQVELNHLVFTLQLAVCPISGKSLAFQKLQDCCWPPGGPNQINPTTHTSDNGLAGMLNKVQIPFQAL